MFTTALGIILLLLPFLLIFYFQNRIRGFVVVLLSLSIFHLIVALFSQYWHFFNYPFILSAHIVLNIGVIYFLIKNRARLSFKLKFNWFLVGAIIIVFFQLWSVHYFYTGQVATINGSKTVEKSAYAYPFFSDEWVGVALTSYAINNNALPTVNPLLEAGIDNNFPNIFIGFFALLAEIFLLLQISPLVGFPMLAIVVGVLLSFLVYLFLRTNHVSNFFAALALLLVPWITNSGNLPGIWFLLPISGGLIFFLVSLIFLNLKSRRWAWLSGLSAVFLYPPLIVLVAPTLVGEFLLSASFDKKINKKKIVKWLGFSLLALILTAALVFFLQPNNWSALLKILQTSLIRDTNDGGIPARFIWHVIPIILLPLAGLGIYFACKRRFWIFLIPLFISLSYWLVYAYSLKFFIIDYGRIAYLAAILIIISAGLGLELLFQWLERAVPDLSRRPARFWLQLFSLALFVLLSVSYTSRDSWKNIVLRFETEDGIYRLPTNPPVSRFLLTEDLELFKNIKQARFLSIPWKGLVVGAATGNYPLASKPSIVTNSLLDYDYFMSVDCNGKTMLAQNSFLEYVYSDEFNCANFMEQGYSSEGFFLYKFIVNK